MWNDIKICAKLFLSSILEYFKTMILTMLNVSDSEFIFIVRKKAKIRNRYNQIPHLTQDIIWESDRNTRKYHIQESQKVSPFPAGDHKAARKRQGSMTITKHKYKKKIHKRSTTFEWSVKQITGGLKHV